MGGFGSGKGGSREVGRQLVSCFLGFEMREEHVHQTSSRSKDPSRIMAYLTTAVLLGTATAGGNAKWRTLR